MAAVESDEFDVWLNSKLKALNTDENVFGSYIKGILEGEESLEDKTEALEGILTEIIGTDIIAHCREILDKWKKLTQSDTGGHANNAVGVSEDMEVRLAKIIESQTKPAAVQRTYTEEEKKIREAILSQYSQMSDDEESEEEERTVSRPQETKENDLVKNTNASSVAQAEKEKRERAKQESQKKKEKDKEDREKQKQQQQEKKEKRKTQKGERRR